MDKKKIKHGFMLIELLVALAIIMFLAFKVLNLYFVKPALNQETQKIIAEQKIDSTNYKTLIDSTKSKLADIQSQEEDRLNRIK